MTIDRATIRMIEECGLRAWPAVESVPRLGWVLQASGGRSRRVNAVSPLEPAGAFDALRAEAERFYRQRDQPCLVRLTPLAAPEADAALEAAGYRHEGDSIVMVRDLMRPTTEPQAPVAIAGIASAAWLAGSAVASGLSPAEAAARDAVMDRIRPAAAFATVPSAGTPSAYGLAVAEQGWVGLFAIVTSPAARRGGIGRRLLRGLLAWGQSRGARQAYLQVDAGNAPALALYGTEHFTEAYRYHYRKRG